LSSGQHQVEQHQVGLPVGGGDQALAAGAAGLDGEPLERQRVLEPAHDVGLVLDDQDALARFGGHAPI
jgi:hypothetical protein